MAELHGCLVTIAERKHWDMQTSGTPQSNGVRLRLMRALRNRRIAIIGDSMGRQLFGTLVHLLRGSDVVIDPFTFRNMSYVQAETANGTLDFLDLPGSRRQRYQGSFFHANGTRRLLPRWAQETAMLLHKSLAWPYRGQPGTGPFESALRIDFYFQAVCYGNNEYATELGRLLEGGRYSFVFVLPPGYWLLKAQCECDEAKFDEADGLSVDACSPRRSAADNLACGSARRLANSTYFNTTHVLAIESARTAAMLSATEGTAQRWATLKELELHGGPLTSFWACATRLKAPNTTAVVLSTPSVNVPARWLADQRRLNELLAARFHDSNSSVFRDGWLYVNWDEITRRLRPASRYGGGWHYACELSPKDAWELKPEDAHKVGVLQTDGCKEEGNTLLWTEELLPRLEALAPHSIGLADG